MGLEDDLRNETEKWLEKITAERKKIIIAKRKEFLKNIDAYISDSKHFLKKGDLIRAFEAVVWAWAWLEIGKQIKILKIRR